MALPSQWFLKKRGLATGQFIRSFSLTSELIPSHFLITGIAVSGASFFGGIDTIVLRLLIVQVGYKHTLLIYTFILSTIWTCAWFLLKVRTPPRKREKAGEEDEESRPWLPEASLVSIRVEPKILR